MGYIENDDGKLSAQDIGDSLGEAQESSGE